MIFDRLSHLGTWATLRIYSILGWGGKRFVCFVFGLRRTAGRIKYE